MGNPYAFLANNPWSYLDPWGLKAKPSLADGLRERSFTVEQPAQDKGYLARSTEQVMLGNFTDEVTALGTAVQIGSGLLGLDFPGDIRDMSADAIGFGSSAWGGRWREALGHAGMFVLDGVTLLPVVGALKYSDEAYTLIRRGPEIYVNVSQAAAKQYPKLAGKLHNHHIIPKYLGGAADGATAKIDAAYHQLITNEFRRWWAYGQSLPSPEQLKEIVQAVYRKYSLP